jgi:asparagine synthase (glutamine-hydrolysing)
MCGFAGWILGASEGVLGDERLAAMAAAIAHRGPDGEGFFRAQTRDAGWDIALAHRRLAIIDPTGGHQPMLDEARDLAIAFNGEVYNFRALREELVAAGESFSTDCDTEVVLKGYAVWGPQVVERMRGMFGFALWDGRAQRVLLARDRFGKKPVFLAPHAGGLLFGSEIKSILAHGAAAPRMDMQSVLDYLVYRYVPGPETLFEGVTKLPPGSYAVWHDGQLEVTKFYTPPDAYVRPEVDPPADPAAALLAELEDAVKVRLVSDVPFGAFLSGGLDSSAIVGLMARHCAQPVNTFSIGFPEREYSELDHAKTVADHFGTHHTPLIVRPETLMEHLPQVVRFRDAPVSETADLPIYLLSVEASKTVKMVLSGEGSDEVLAGYPKHWAERYAQTYHRFMPGRAHRRLIEPIVGHLPYRFRRAKTLASTIGIADVADRWPRWFGAMTAHERDALCRLDVPPRPPNAVVRIPPGDRRTALRRILGFDQTSWLPDNLLERGDRMTMGASIEARMPFMDHEFIAFASRLPDDMRVRGTTGKWLLRRAVTQLLPPQIIERPKVGFRVPVNEWFRTSLSGYLRDHLIGSASLTRDFYDTRALTRVLDEHIGGRHNHEKLLWTLLNLEIFQRHYRLPTA